MASIQHSQRFQGRADEIRGEKKQRIFRGSIMFVGSILILIILGIPNIFPAFSVNGVLKDILSLGFVLLFLIGTTILSQPLSDYNLAFLNLVESMEIIEKSGTTSKSNIVAYKKILKAHSRLVQKPRKPWLTETRKIESEFLKNLKFRVAPAVKDDELNPRDLADIVRAIQSTNITSLNSLNEQLTQYDEKEIIEKNIKNIISPYVNSFIGKIIISIIISGGFLFILTYFGIRALELQFLDTIRNNLITLIAVFVASIFGTLNLIKDRDFLK